MSNNDVWNETPLNTNFIRPWRGVGLVLVNGKISTGMTVVARNTANPYYKLPSGQHIEMLRRVRRADIVYNVIDNGTTSNLYVNNFNAMNSDSDKVYGLSSLNGRGTNSIDAGDNHSLMSKINPIGLAGQATEFNGIANFNIHTGGIETVPNNGNQRINPGQWVMAYAPALSELSEGGRGDEADQNGLVTLWFVPYTPESHKLTCNNIHRCLVNDRSDCSKAFRDVAELFYKTCVDIAIIVHKNMGKSEWERLVELNGSESPTMYMHKRDKIIMEDYEVKRDLSNALFQHHRRRTTDDKNQISISNPGEALITATALMVKDVTKNIMGKAVTGAGPKEDFDLQLCHYAR